MIEWAECQVLIVLIVSITVRASATPRFKPSVKNRCNMGTVTLKRELLAAIIAAKDDAVVDT